MTAEARAKGASEAMDALMRGDRLALSRLIALYGPGIRAFAAHQLGDASEAEDIAQEVFLRVWSEARRYDPARGAVSTWIWRIAANLCTDRRRRRAVRRFLGLEAVPEAALPDDAMPGAERIVAGREQMRQLGPALAALPDRQREALLMRTAGELATAEIAAAMGLSPGAVEQLLVRARAGLRRTMGEKDDD
ncbi:MAG: sigma-70 family RNA polymerase sigma factor [Rhodobacteraceae bacterium]|nr:sigma-70 family RNA polymerase sigma factor [Paracoccaceae bacterium]